MSPINLSEDKSVAVPILGNDNVKLGENVPLVQLTINGRLTEIRSSFAQAMGIKDEILKEEEMLMEGNKFPFKELREGCTGVVSNQYRCLISNHLKKPFIFKYKQYTKNKTKFEAINKYTVNHLRRSLAKTVMGDETRDPLFRAIIATYVLYDYWFHSKKTIREVTHNVIVDIRTLISYIIDNSCNEFYRELETNAMVSALRVCLNNQELVQEGTK